MKWYERLKETRLKNKKTQQDLAKVLGKDVTRISRYELGNGAKNMPFFMKEALKNVFTEDEIWYIENGEEVSNISKNISIVKNSSLNHQVLGEENSISSKNVDEDIVLVSKELKKLKAKDKMSVKTILMQLTEMSTEQINKVLMSTFKIGMEKDVNV